MNLPPASQLSAVEAHLENLLACPVAEQNVYLAGLPMALREFLEQTLKNLAAIDDLPRGFRCGNFELTGERPQRGGFGIVYRAEHRVLDEVLRYAAVKFVLPKLLVKEATVTQHFLKPFFGELKRLMALNNPNVVTVYECGVLPNDARCRPLPWFAMEHLSESTDLTPAPSLKDRDARVSCFRRVCDAVGDAHRHGILHLDLSPKNIRVLPDGTPKVIDFGLGEWLCPAHPNMPWLLNRGTLPYMAPEQLDSRFGQIDTRTDVHALGILLYQVLTTHLPYELRESTEEEFRCLICDPGRLPLSRYLAGEDRKIEEIVARAFHRDPAERFPDAGELCGALDAWMAFPQKSERDNAEIR